VGEEREREEKGLDFVVAVVVELVFSVEKEKLCAWVDAESARSVLLVARRSVDAIDAEGTPFIGRTEASVELRGDNGDGCIGV
jgi:hypothetical protein